MPPSAVWSYVRHLRLVPAVLVGLALCGCSQFVAFRRAEAERNAVCVSVCEQVLERPSLGLADANGTCACLAPAQGWDSAGGTTMVRIQSRPPLTLAHAGASSR